MAARRHGSFLCGSVMQTGERSAYPIMILVTIAAVHQCHINNGDCDIGPCAFLCTWLRFLCVLVEENPELAKLLDSMRLPLPAFHRYMHRAACQALFVWVASSREPECTGRRRRSRTQPPQTSRSLRARAPGVCAPAYHPRAILGSRQRRGVGVLSPSHLSVVAPAALWERFFPKILNHKPPNPTLSPAPASTDH